MTLKNTHLPAEPIQPTTVPCGFEPRIVENEDKAIVWEIGEAMLQIRTAPHKNWDTVMLPRKK